MKTFLPVSLQNSWNARAKLLYHFQILVYPHDLFVAGNRIAFKKLLFGGLDERTVTVFVVFNQIHTIGAAVFGNFDGHIVFIGQQVSSIVERSVFGDEFKVLFKLLVEWLFFSS